MLTSQEREKLILRHRKERDGRIRALTKAVLAYDDGYNYSEIARILLLDDKTKRQHIDDYRLENKLSTSNGGSIGKLTDREEFELKEYLEHITCLYVKDICHDVKRQYKLKYSPPYSPNLNPAEREINVTNR